MITTVSFTSRVHSLTWTADAGSEGKFSTLRISKNSENLKSSKHNRQQFALSPARMRRCLRLRPSIPLPPPRPFPRTIHTTPVTRAQASFTDSFRRPVEEELEENEDLDDVEDSANSESDDTAYAERVSAQSYQRWRESQDPQAGLQFMTMGREFTIPYSLTQLSNMSNNHLRELRAYYRKMMYEMPQFKSILLPIRVS